MHKTNQILYFLFNPHFFPLGNNIKNQYCSQQHPPPLPPPIRNIKLDYNIVFYKPKTKKNSTTVSIIPFFFYLPPLHVFIFSRLLCTIITTSFYPPFCSDVFLPCFILFIREKLGSGRKGIMG
jgi:hypothetical protein